MSVSVNPAIPNSSPPDTADPKEVAAALHTTMQGLAQMRYRGSGPKFIKLSRKVIYRWSDVNEFLDQNTIIRTDDPRGLSA